MRRYAPSVQIATEAWRARDGSTFKGAAVTTIAQIKEAFIEDAKRFAERDCYPDELLKTIKSIKEAMDLDSKIDHRKDVGYVSITHLTGPITIRGEVIKTASGLVKGLDAIGHYIEARSQYFDHLVESIKYIKNGDIEDAYKNLAPSEMLRVGLDEEFLGGWYLTKSRKLDHDIISIGINYYEPPSTSNLIANHIKPFDRSEVIKVVGICEKLLKAIGDSYYRAGDETSSVTAKVFKEASSINAEMEKDPAVHQALMLICDFCLGQHFNIVTEMCNTIKVILRICEGSIRRWHTG